MAVDATFWKNKNVLITGHTGFKGSWLCLWLNQLGAKVTGYSLPPPTNPSLFELANVSSLVNSIIGDVRDHDKLVRVVKETEPEIVIHMAAQPLVRDSYKNPVETYAINVMGTVNLLDAVRLYPGIKAVVNVTTDKCYENREWVWGYRENEPMGGYDPYSNSKGCSELVTSAFRNSFFNPNTYREHGIAIASARAGNVIGGGDWAQDRIVPDCMQSILDGIPIIIRNPHAVRPWQHVLEPLSGYLMLAQKLWQKGAGYSEGWNFGPADGDCVPVYYVVNAICENWGSGASFVLSHEIGPHEAAYLKLDCSKAYARINWKPRWNIDAAIKKIVEWYKTFQSSGKIAEITLQQINEYQC